MDDGAARPGLRAPHRRGDPMLLLPVLASAALAAPLDLSSRALVADEAPAATGGGVAAPAKAPRKVAFEVNFRVRRLMVPSGLLTTFGFEDDTEDYNWALRPTSDYCVATPGSKACGTARPTVNAMSYGVEFLAKFNRDTVLFYFDYADSEMQAGYWDDSEDGDDPDDNDDGDFLAPGPNFGAILAGVNYQADIAIVKPSKTKGAFGMDFTAGAGLGLLVLVGQLDRWDGESSPTPAYEQYDRGDEPRPDGEVGRFWPAVDVNLGFKFTFAERAVLRLEGGLHTMLYFGGSVGFRF